MRSSFARFNSSFAAESFQIKCIGLRIIGWLRRETCLFFRSQFCPKSRRDLRRHLALEADGIGERAVVTLRPEVAVVACVDQLDVDEHAVALAPHAPFQDILHSQFPGDVAQVTNGARAAVLRDRSAANDLQIADLRQTGQNIVLDSIGEKSVLLVRAQVLQGKNSDRFFRQRRRGVRSNVRLLAPE